MISPQARVSHTIPIKGLDTRNEVTKERVEPTEDLVIVPLHDGNPQHVVCIYSKLDKVSRHQLKYFLQKMLSFLLGPLLTC